MRFLKLFISFYVFICCLQCYSQNEETIAWSSEVPLTWNEFKGEYNTKSDAAALTASGLTFGYSISQTDNNIVSYSADVFAHFYPDRSWVKPDSNNDYILAHEQLHFDITELHARLLRKELTRLLISNNLRQRIKRIHDRINLDLDKMQNLYDSETNHSIDREAQERWNKEVKAAMIALKEYASPYVSGGNP